LLAVRAKQMPVNVVASFRRFKGQTNRWDHLIKWIALYYSF
jgi:hypothetical protein